MTYESYPNQPKSMLEWKLIEELDKNAETMGVFNNQNCSHPIIREFCDIDRVEFYI